MLRRYSVWALLGAACALAGDDANGGMPSGPQHDAVPAKALNRFGTTRWRHATAIYFVAVMPDNKAVLTASDDHVIRLWDRQSGTEIRRFESSSVRRPFRPHPFKFYSGFGPDDSGRSHATVSRDGKTLAALLPNNVLQLWDVDTGKESRQFKRREGMLDALRFSPCGKLVAIRGGCQELVLFDVEMGKERRVNHGPKDGMVSPGARAGMAFAPDGKVLANGKMGHDGAKLFTFVQLIDVKSGEEIRRFETALRTPAALAFAPDGAALAFSDHTTIQLVNPASGKKIRQIEAPERITALVFSGDGKLLFGKALDQQVRAWSSESGKLLHEWGDKLPFVEKREHGASEECDLALSADGKLLVWADGQTLRLWDTGAGKDLAPPTGHRAAVTGLRVGEDARAFVSYGEDETLRRWDLRTGKSLEQRAPAGTTIAAIAPDTQSAALANIDGTIRLIDLATGKQIRRFSGHRSFNIDRLNDTVDLVFSFDGRILASQGSFDCVIRLHDVARGAELRQLKFGDPAPLDEFRPDFVVTGGMGLAFSADGQVIAACETHMVDSGPRNEEGWHTASLRRWDVATGKELQPFVLPARRLITEIAFAPDGRLLAAVHTDQTVSLYETSTGRERAVLGKPRPSQLVSAWTYQRRYEPPPTRTLVFAPDGSRLLSRAPLDTVRVWDVRSGQEIGQLKRHDGPVPAIAFTPDGKSVVTGGNDTAILLREVPSVQNKPTPEVALDAMELELLWADLAEANAVNAFAGMRRLAAGPKQSVPYLRRRLKPESADVARIERLIASLDSGDFRNRANAGQELESLGAVAFHHLKKARASTLSLEACRRIDPLLEKLTPTALSPDEIRLVRCVEVLELMASVDARQILETLASGAPGALTTRHAEGALARLAGRAGAR